MRTPQELQAKLEETKSSRSKYNAIGDSSVWEYWNTFGSILRSVIEFPLNQAGLRDLRRCAIASERHQIAAMYSWMLEPPAPVIDEAVRAQVQARANKTRKVYYIRARPGGTYISLKPVGLGNVVIEPQGQPVKLPNQTIRKELRPQMIREAEAQRRLG